MRGGFCALWVCLRGGRRLVFHSCGFREKKLGFSFEMRFVCPAGTEAHSQRTSPAFLSSERPPRTPALSHAAQAAQTNRKRKAPQQNPVDIKPKLIENKKEFQIQIIRKHTPPNSSALSVPVRLCPKRPRRESGGSFNKNLRILPQRQTARQKRRRLHPCCATATSAASL